MKPSIPLINIPLSIGLPLIRQARVGEASEPSSAEDS